MKKLGMRVGVVAFLLGVLAVLVYLWFSRGA